MPLIIGKQDIISTLKRVDAIEAMKQAFIAYSNGNTVVPPVAELLFDNPKGETHIKYGYVKSESYFVVKIASGFYENTKLGISSSQGIVLLFSQKTGQIKAMLLDEGYLTDIRTASAGALVAKHYAPKNIKGVGIVGAGIQAKLQLQYLQKHNPCKKVWVWNRTPEGGNKFASELKNNFDIKIANDTSQLAEHCNFIITTTPSEYPLIRAKDLRKGTHITAVGSDTSKKQELESALLARADILVVDSICQSKSRGEVYRAVKDGLINRSQIIELGNAIQDKSLQRKDDGQITIVDLTGVAVQDVVIAKSVFEVYDKNLKKRIK